jgi:hypothetical protein
MALAPVLAFVLVVSGLPGWDTPQQTAMALSAEACSSDLAAAGWLTPLAAAQAGVGSSTDDRSGAEQAGELPSPDGTDAPAEGAEGVEAPDGAGSGEDVPDADAPDLADTPDTPDNPDGDASKPSDPDDAASPDGKDLPSDDTDAPGIKPAEGLAALLGGELATLDEGDEVLGVGDSFTVASDQGISVRYQILAPGDRVQVGLGIWLNSDSADVANQVTVRPNYTGTITIPSTVERADKSYRVVRIAPYAFRSLRDNRNAATPYQLSEIVLPETIEVIDGSAFSGATNLRRVVFPRGSGMTYLGSEAFLDARRFSSFVLPASLTSIGTNVFAYSGLTDLSFEAGCKLTVLPSGTFRSCPLTAITLPASIREIGDEAFAGSGLPSIDIPATVTSMGVSVFSGSSVRTARFAVDSPLKELPAKTFADCKALAGFEFPPNMAFVGNSAFNASGLVSLSIPATITYLGTDVFSSCSSLRTVAFVPENRLMILSDRLFFNCAVLSSVTLPDSIRSIGESAFTQCRSLAYFEVPRSVNSLGDAAFQECTALTTLVFRGDASKTSFEHSTFYNASALTRIVFYDKKSRGITLPSVAPEKLRYYYSINFYADQASVGNVLPTRFVIRANAIPESVGIGDIYAGIIPNPPTGQRWIFEDGFRLTGEITNSFYAYARSAAPDHRLGDVFSYPTAEGSPLSFIVTGLAAGNTPGTVTLGTKAGTAALAAGTTGSLTVRQEAIGDDGQYYTITEIGSRAFADCTRFVGVTIPATVRTIGQGAFARCTALRNIEFLGDAASIVDLGLFLGCANIDRVIFGGKKANLSFGLSYPKNIYYTVRYYENAHDRQIDNRLATLVVKERSLLGALTAGSVLSGGSVPTLSPGQDWRYEDGFAADIALVDSCWAYGDGVGFQVMIPVRGGSDAQVLCWFKILDFDEEGGTGTVQMGLGIDGLTAVHSSTSGTLLLPATITDGEGKSYAVTSIGSFALGASNVALQCERAQIELPAGLLSIQARAFLNCRGLSGSITIPSSVVSLGVSAFEGCTRLSTVRMAADSRLTALPASAFASCTALSSVTLPGNLASIGAQAFDHCSRLGTISFPARVRNIGQRAFEACSQLRTMVFEGDASAVSFGSRAFYLYDRPGAAGVLERITFRGKKAPSIGDYIVTGGDSPVNEYRRTYYLYYTVYFYANAAHLAQGGPVLKRSDVREDYTALNLVPTLTAGNAWRVEPGFAFASPTTDSYYAYVGRDLGAALVSGVKPEYSYYEEADARGYIRPVPVLTMPDGVVLVEGQDYSFDTSKGANGDGYVNNRRQGTASIYLVGINDYAGTKLINFNILGVVDSSAVMDVRLAGQRSFTYTGEAIEPEVSVSVSFRGITVSGIQGVDYELSYRDNIDADQRRAERPARVVVRGLGMYGGTTELAFSIKPYPLALCDIGGYLERDREDATMITPRITVTRTETGRSLNEGEDFSVNYRQGTNTGTSSLYVLGQGNYQGTVRMGFEPSSGSGGGAGGGTGGGIGSGTGDGSGSGGIGSSGTGDPQGRGLDGEVVSMGGVEGGEASAEGGGGNEGRYAIYDLGFVQPIDELPAAPEAPSRIALVLAILSLLAALSGAGFRYRGFRRAIASPALAQVPGV